MTDQPTATTPTPKPKPPQAAWKYLKMFTVGRVAITVFRKAYGFPEVCIEVGGVGENRRVGRHILVHFKTEGVALVEPDFHKNGDLVKDFSECLSLAVAFAQEERQKLQYEFLEKRREKEERSLSRSKPTGKVKYDGYRQKGDIRR